MKQNQIQIVTLSTISVTTRLYDTSLREEDIELKGH